jgi:hypothetical protein
VSGSTEFPRAADIHSSNKVTHELQRTKTRTDSKQQGVAKRYILGFADTSFEIAFHIGIIILRFTSPRTHPSF